MNGLLILKKRQEFTDFGKGGKVELPKGKYEIKKIASATFGYYEDNLFCDQNMIVVAGKSVGVPDRFVKSSKHMILREWERA